MRGTDHDTASQHHPTYPSQHVDVSRLSSQVSVADPNGLMNGYASAPHSQYPNTSSPLAHAPNDATGLAGQPSSVQSPQPQQPQQSQQRRNNVSVPPLEQATATFGGVATLLREPA